MAGRTRVCLLLEEKMHKELVFSGSPNFDPRPPGYVLAAAPIMALDTMASMAARTSGAWKRFSKV